MCELNKREERLGRNLTRYCNNTMKKHKKKKKKKNNKKKIKKKKKKNIVRWFDLYPTDTLHMTTQIKQNNIWKVETVDLQRKEKLYEIKAISIYEKKKIFVLKK